MNDSFSVEEIVCFAIVLRFPEAGKHFLSGAYRVCTLPFALAYSGFLC